MDIAHLISELKRRFSVDKFEKKREKKHEKEDSFWVDTFHQIYVERRSRERDDLVFIVKWDDKQNCEQVEVFRRDAVSLPSPRDETVLWEQTLYLNVILHEFDYHVTCGVVTVNDGVVDSVSRRVEQQVYPSPNQRRMDKKDSVSDVVYPNVWFHVDNFEEVFKDLYSTVPGEKCAVQLMASNKSADVKKLVFLGAVDHNVLKEAYDKKDETRLASFSSKLKNLSFKSRNSRVFDLTGPYHFVQMRGPHKKGFAEVAIWKQDLSLLKLRNSKFDDIKSSGTSHFFGSSEASASPSDKSISLQNHSDDSVVCEESRGEVGDDTNAELSSVKETVGGLFKLKSFFYGKSCQPEKPERKDSTSNPSIRMYTYLTFLQLPWYTLIDDILNCTKEEAL